MEPRWGTWRVMVADVPGCAAEPATLGFGVQPLRGRMLDLHVRQPKARLFNSKKQVVAGNTGCSTFFMLGKVDVENHTTGARVELRWGTE